MKKQTPATKQINLTPSCKLALMEASNDGGIMKNAKHDVQQVLLYLGLVERVPKFPQPELKKRAAEAWKKMAAAIARMDAKEVDAQLHIVKSEEWDMGKMIWRMTPAGYDCLVTGRVYPPKPKRGAAK